MGKDDVPIQPQVFEGDPTLSSYEQSKSDLAFRAQVAGRSEGEQLAHDIENIGGRVVSAGDVQQNVGSRILSRFMHWRHN